MSHESNIKLLSEIGKYELINVNDGEKYDCLQNNDLVVDDLGNIKFLIINVSNGKLGFLGGSREFIEIPWECVKKIGARTIILDAEENDIKKATI
ncbi:MULTISPECIES: YlmC/YmxH family sporulation protein [Clostridium]|uniref:YlmC/YmxH family sporulation protein n=1 Tax=Clostridium cibarium TaxID=2762247 RepID=A0ABR8PQL5_9CLOT|nr:MULTISPECIES: YlmC/YmxH family sporulation protein [Clostridium]MBD7910462.1 YlmC/YmxH family sporulation protein [Clostridium cibarium]